MPATEYCLFWIDWWPLCMTKAEWSGWMQAIGAVVAILASAGFVRWQHELERGRQREVDAELRQRQHSALVALARATVAHAKWLRTRLPDRETFVEIASERKFLDREDIVRLARPLEAIPLHEIDDPTMLLEIIVIIEHCRTVRTMLQSALTEARQLDAGTFKGLFGAFDTELGQLSTHLVVLSDRAKHLASNQTPAPA